MNHTPERRSHRRYGLELPLRYRLLKKTPITVEVGMTRNMSSGGAALLIDSELAVGEQIELWVEWPGSPQNRIELHLAGEVVRSGRADTAIIIKRHDFVAAKEAFAADSA
jgi:hypothetical protein